MSLLQIYEKLTRFKFKDIIPYAKHFVKYFMSVILPFFTSSPINLLKCFLRDH